MALKLKRDHKNKQNIVKDDLIKGQLQKIMVILRKIEV